MSPTALQKAVARLEVTLGEQKFLIERKLSDLGLARFEIDGVPQPLSEDNYQLVVAQAVGVWSFGDFVLMLRYLVFYFEDRRALVWDPSAQRQVLRLLYLPADVAETWTKNEREILELDSRMRNLQAALGREERQLSEVLYRAAGGENVRQQLSLLEKLQAQDRAKLEAAEEETVGLEAAREKARLEHLLTERERDARLRNLERAKLAAIDARFPKRSETARYILAHFMTEAECLVCGNRAPEAAATYLGRVKHRHCVVCDTKLQQIANVIDTTDLADKRTEQSRVELVEADDALVKRSADLKQADEAHRAHVEQLTKLEAATADRAVKINALVRNLPRSETAVYEQRDAVNTIRATLARLQI